MERERIDARSQHWHRTFSRRRALRLGGGTLAVALLAGNGAVARAVPAVTALDSTATSQVFVGSATDLGTFVAIVLPSAGATTVHAYICDGASTDAWLVGTLHDNQLDLHSTDWETLTARVAGDTVNGSATLSDGRILDFSLARATGIQGLYDVEMDADGRLTGQGSTGQRLEGRLVETLAGGTVLLAGTVAGQDKVLQSFAVFASADARGSLRWIVLPNLQIKGSAKTGHGAGITFPDVEF